MPDTRKLYTGRCHCGAVAIKVKLVNGLNTARRCTCSMCSKRGAVAVGAKLDDVEIIKGESKLSLYTFGTHSAQHYFCSNCGIYIYHRSRSNPHEYGINVACFDGFSPFLDSVPVLDGKNHPRDIDTLPGKDGRTRGEEIGQLIFQGDRSRL